MVIYSYNCTEKIWIFPLIYHNKDDRDHEDRRYMVARKCIDVLTFDSQQFHHCQKTSIFTVSSKQSKLSINDLWKQEHNIDNNRSKTHFNVWLKKIIYMCVIAFLCFFVGVIVCVCFYVCVCECLCQCVLHVSVCVMVVCVCVCAFRQNTCL